MAAATKNVQSVPYSKAELYDPDLPGYTGEALSMISFPLGGIGTGTIGLGGRGELRDWEIFNSPKLGYRPDYTMPYIFAKQGTETYAKVLERKLLPPHHKSEGLPPEQFAGVPRMEEAIFVGTYPIGRVFFQDESLPVNVRLEAFNPMIPGNAADSAIPAAVLVYTVHNPTRKPVSGSIGLSMANTIGNSTCCGAGLGENVNAYREGPGLRGISMTSKKHKVGHAAYGTQALVTLSKKVTYATDFDEPGWFDKGQKVWDDYSKDGKLDGPTKRTKPSADKKTVIGMLTAGYNLKPGKSAEIVFIIGWSFPTQMSGWHIMPAETPLPLQNHYAKKFSNAWKAVSYVAKNFDRLRAATLKFEETLFESTLPGTVLDAVSSQMAIIRTPTTLWLDTPEDEKLGRIIAFEGCSTDEGCCPMNCNHVWNYEQSLAHLYPSLERTMRASDFDDCMHHRGAMSFRTAVPLKQGVKRWNLKRPAADGQFGTVVKAHREWRISGDDAWLKSLWPQIKQALEYAWKGFSKWDADKDGVIEGVQHNTYDIEFYGPNTMCGSLYLAALLAGAEMAEAMGNPKAAAEYREIFKSGQAKYDKMLFNGSYYTQKVSESAKAYTDPSGRHTPAGRPKYQYGHGCLSDQLLGQWTAHVAGLGYVLPQKHVAKAMESVFKYNFKADLSEHQCVQRVYALNDEAGLINCSWPKGKREKFPFPYSDEVWTGIEYQVAAHLIYEGMIDEGLAVVNGIRERHDGLARNPWNEFECGDHYARAMASWSVLLALSGQFYDGRAKRLTMKPLVNKNNFNCIYTAADAYGQYSQTVDKGKVKIAVDCRAGRIGLAELAIQYPLARAPKTIKVRASLNGKAVKASATIAAGEITVTLAKAVTLKEDDRLTLSLS